MCIHKGYQLGHEFAYPQQRLSGHCEIVGPKCTSSTISASTCYAERRAAQEKSCSSSFGGLPATGKTTLARELARQLGAVYLRIDTIEQAIAPTDVMSVGEAGYRVGYAVAEDNLRLGRIVVADSVNPLRITRDAWRNAAKRSGVVFIEVLVVCSDRTEHRRRVETRKTDVVGGGLVSWQDVLTREFERGIKSMLQLILRVRPLKKAWLRFKQLCPSIDESAPIFDPV
jgi:predicted kinase